MVEVVAMMLMLAVVVAVGPVSDSNSDIDPVRRLRIDAEVLIQAMMVY